jgi:hypothetical protein
MGVTVTLQVSASSWTVVTVTHLVSAKNQIVMTTKQIVSAVTLCAATPRTCRIVETSQYWRKQ